MRAAGLLLLIAAPLLAQATEPTLQLARRDGQEDVLLTLNRQQVLSRQALPASLSAPLGSLWKLFVYAYQTDLARTEAPYHCSGRDREEVYCCEPGQSVDRGQALVKSCGLYFAPQRLEITPAAWRQYWQTQQAPDWLTELSRLTPETRVPVHELLRVLATLPGRDQAQNLLLDVTLNAGGDPAGALGSVLRVKTWSWHENGDAQTRVGGFAGWLSDGSPVWAQGAGTSKTVLNQYADALAAALPPPALSRTADDGCVVVKLFSRYPLTSVLRQEDGQTAAQGMLHGRYDVLFANGNRLALESRGELFLTREGDAPRLTARLTREEYVARVIEREAKTEPEEAAKAMAVAIRSYLQQNARREGECLLIDDSSASQRVAPSPAGTAARAIAARTASLVLAGTTVNYHYDSAGEARMSWLQAVEQAKSGMRYNAILAQAFPRGNLSRWDNPQASCQPLPDAEAWLRGRQRDWRITLNREPGYVATEVLAVCRLASGRPYTDRAQRRIYVRNFYSLQDRLDLTHEYLHLAFDGYPSSQDEHYIESLTRQLLLE